jgi:hypothetical protein
MKAGVRIIPLLAGSLVFYRTALSVTGIAFHVRDLRLRFVPILAIQKVS